MPRQLGRRAGGGSRCGVRPFQPQRIRPGPADRPARRRRSRSGPAPILSSAESGHALEHAARQRHAAVTIVSHSFALANRLGTGVNAVHVRRFAALCAMLAASRSVLPTVHYGDRPPLALRQDDRPLAPARLRPRWRQAEQLWSNLSPSMRPDRRRPAAEVPGPRAHAGGGAAAAGASRCRRPDGGVAVVAGGRARRLHRRRPDAALRPCRSRPGPGGRQARRDPSFVGVNGVARAAVTSSAMVAFPPSRV